MSESPIENRKNEHLRLVFKENVDSECSAGWENIVLPHQALPELNFDDVDLNTRFLDLDLSIPLFISSMTGGTAEGERINELLCELAQNENILMGVGSQRIALEHREKKTFDLRRKFPRAKLFANIGLVQLNYGVSLDDCAWLVDNLEAQGLILHANVLQESIQFEGDRNFKGLLGKISQLKKKIKVPLILKETGCGLDPKTCLRAFEEGIDALDIAGMGGTHWGYIEGLRHPNTERKELGNIFRNWGLPAAQALIDARSTLGSKIPLIASGGIRTGLDASKALYAGAQMVGMAAAFLRASEGGYRSLQKFLSLQKEALKIAFFCSGSRTAADLRGKNEDIST